jgi:phosphate uptake regulator
MFGDVIKTRKRTALLYDAIEEVLSMLERAERMFAIVCGCLLSEEEAAADVDKEDKAINAGEALVRRLILEHLTLNPDQDLPTSLAVLSIIHDVERLGDYAKSLVELNQFSHLCDGDSPHAQQCSEIHGAIAPLFGQTLEALRESDAQLAATVMRRHEGIKKTSDEFLETVMAGIDTQRDAVLFTLSTRYFRRTSAHLANIASSVANPLDRISGKVAER